MLEPWQKLENSPVVLNNEPWGNTMQIIQPNDEVNLRSEHKHQCDNCKTAWKHSNEMLGNEDEHTCPRCGTKQWNKLLTKHDEDLLLGIVMYDLLQGRSDSRRRELNRLAGQQFYCEL